MLDGSPVELVSELGIGPDRFGRVDVAARAPATLDRLSEARELGLVDRIDQWIPILDEALTSLRLLEQD